MGAPFFLLASKKPTTGSDGRAYYAPDGSALDDPVAEPARLAVHAAVQVDATGELPLGASAVAALGPVLDGHVAAASAAAQ